MTCCIQYTMCDPATDEPIIVVGTAGSPNYLTARNLQDWTGDPDTLELCGNQFLTADAQDQPWDANNPAWIDPATAPKWMELRIDNGVTGCEIWRRLEDVNGAPQWHQVA